MWVLGNSPLSVSDAGQLDHSLCLRVLGVSQGCFPGRSGTMNSLRWQGGRLIQALLHFVALLPVAPVLQLQHPLLPMAPHGQLLSAGFIQEPSSPPASLKHAKPLNTARRAPHYCQFLAEEAHQIPRQLGSKTLHPAILCFISCSPCAQLGYGISCGDCRLLKLSNVDAIMLQALETQELAGIFLLDPTSYAIHLAVVFEHLPLGWQVTTQTSVFQAC